MRFSLTNLLFILAFLLPALPFHKARVAANPSPNTELDRYPKDFFGLPVDRSVKLTGTFGELRPNHFHAGIDIKSANGRSGDPVVAAGVGYIAKIKVQAGGYGNVLYLNHPNGFTTVYAHLDRFRTDIQQWVRDQQYKQEAFEIELDVPPGLFTLQRGDLLGAMGNTGGSSGPHLHFEIRNTATDHPINPLLFGLPVLDNIKPEILDLKAYFLGDNLETLAGKAFKVVKISDGKYKVSGTDTILVPPGWVGFGIKSYDKLNGLPNNNGINILRLFADGILRYQWTMDELDFDETRFINAHTDFPVRKKYATWFHRCYVMPGNYLSNYARIGQNGAILLFPRQSMPIHIEALDASGNLSQLSFVVKADPTLEKPLIPLHQFAIPYGSDSRLELDGASLLLPKGTVYETLFFKYGQHASKNPNIYSPVHRIHDETVPAHDYFEISLRADTFPQALREKAVIAKIEEGLPDNCGGIWAGNWLTTHVREFGQYCIMADTRPPTITSLVFAPDMRKKDALVFRIRDDFAVNGGATYLNFKGTVDGKWILFEYDRKTARLIHRFTDSPIEPGEHVLSLKVWDDRNNVAEFSGNFIR